MAFQILESKIVGWSDSDEQKSHLFFRTSNDIVCVFLPKESHWPFDHSSQANIATVYGHHLIDSRLAVDFQRSKLTGSNEQLRVNSVRIVLLCQNTWTFTISLKWFQLASSFCCLFRIKNFRLFVQTKFHSFDNNHRYHGRLRCE